MAPKPYPTMLKQPIETSLKDQLRATRIAQGLIDGKTYTQIARELGFSRTSLYDVMAKQGVQEIMQQEINKLEVRVPTWIQELWDSADNKSKRRAVTELRKAVERAQNKLIRTWSSR